MAKLGFLLLFVFVSVHSAAQQMPSSGDFIVLDSVNEQAIGLPSRISPPHPMTLRPGDPTGNHVEAEISYLVLDTIDIQVAFGFQRWALLVGDMDHDFLLDLLVAYDPEEIQEMTVNRNAGWVYIGESSGALKGYYRRGTSLVPWTKIEKQF